jgi:hypothetical protein
MERDHTRRDKAIRRNLAELNNAIVKRRALIGLHSAKSSHTLDFFTIAADALFNDIVAHAILVLDRSSQSASFWYLHRCEGARIDKFAKVRGISLDELAALAERFNGIRDNTHFHIDRDAVVDPRKVWSDAGITGDELGWALDSTYALLADLAEELLGARPQLPDYDGSDAPKIIRAYKEQHPDAKLVV